MGMQVSSSEGQLLAWLQRLHKCRFLLVISYICVLVLLGFAPYFMTLTRMAVPDVHWVIHIHAILYVGWLVLLFEQARRIFTGDIRGHMKLGERGIAYGISVLILGIIVAFAGPALRFEAGDMSLDEAAGFLLYTIGVMCLFGILFFLVVRFRRKPEVHKRFILMAAVALAFAACARLIPTTQNPPAFLLLWLSPILLMLALDVVKDSRHSRIYLAGMAFMILIYGRVFLAGSEIWLPIGRRIITMITA
jgi:hypothetical protein